MKKVIIVLCMALFSVAVNAQDVRVGVTAGMNYSSPKDCEAKLGFNAGVKGELSLDNDVFISASLLLNQKGWKSKGYFFSETNEARVWHVRPYFLELPIHIGYKFNLGEKTKLFVSGGPFLSYGLFGDSHYTSEIAGNKTKHKIGDTFKEKQQDRFDWGLGASVGIEFCRNYQISASYNHSFKKFNKDSEAKNRVLSLNLTYMF